MMKSETTPSAPLRLTLPHGAVVPPRLVSSAGLLKAGDEVEIRLGADVRRLRRTCSGKLILTR